MKLRFTSGLLVLALMLSSLFVPLPAAADEPVGEGQAPANALQAQPGDVESPTVNDYLWIAGSSFKPRSSSIAYQYVGNGCITSLTGGSALNQSYTAPFRVPNGSVIRGVRFYYYDTSAQDSMLSITSYDGAGGFTDHIFAYSQGSSGAGNVYVALAAPYTVDTAARGLVFNWYPNAAGSTMQLCGARLFYDKGAVSAAPATAPVSPGGPAGGDKTPAPDSPFVSGFYVSSEGPTATTPAAAPAAPGDSVLDDRLAPGSPLVSDYYFLAGSSFNRRDSLTSYQYGSSGCIYATNPYSLFTIDVNMPDGARIYGARFFYYDTNASKSIAFYLTDYTGLGAFRDLLTGNSSDGGFGSVYVPMGASNDPYTVDQFTYSLNAIAIGADASNLQLCGVRVFYNTPAISAAGPAGEEASGAAGVIDIPVDGDTSTAVNASLPARSFAQDLELPQGSVAQGLRVFYFNTQAPDGYVQQWNYTGTSADYLGTTTTTGHSGFDSIYQAFGTPYTVDYFSASMGVVPWIVYNPKYKFCGVRVYYTQGAISRYRFIAGSAFHPRDSSTRFSYEGTGCISVMQSKAYVPVTRR